MNLIIKRLSDEVESIKGDTLLYVQTEDGTNVRAEICTEAEVSNYIYILKSDYNIKQVIYFDL
jgi:translation initiation factor IF-1